MGNRFKGDDTRPARTGRMPRWSSCRWLFELLLWPNDPAA